MLYKKYRSFKWGTVHPSISRGWQTATCQSLRFDKKSFVGFVCRTLTSGNLSAPWHTRMHSTSFERSTFFLQHKISKQWIAALLRWFMLCQSSLILLHKVAFQPFWLLLTVCQFHKQGKSTLLMRIFVLVLIWPHFQLMACKVTKKIFC